MSNGHSASNCSQVGVEQRSNHSETVVARWSNWSRIVAVTTALSLSSSAPAPFLTLTPVAYVNTITRPLRNSFGCDLPVGSISTASVQTENNLSVVSCPFKLCSCGSINTALWPQLATALFSMWQPCCCWLLVRLYRIGVDSIGPIWIRIDPQIKKYMILLTLTNIVQCWC